MLWYNIGMDIQTLKEEIAGLHDARRTAYGHIRHKLEDIVITGLCVAICGGEDFSDMETFGREREQWLRQFLELPNGIPDADTFRRVFERLDPQELGRCLRRWLAVERGRRGVVAVDGKTIKGSANAKHGAYHVLGLKGNQPELLEDVRLYFGSFGASTPAKSTLDKGHGRVERREYSLATDVGWMAQRLQWAGLSGVGRVVSTVWEKDAERTQTRYFVTSLTDVGEFAYAVRRHWSIESQLHWCLDVVFREDASRARKDNSPLNMNILRKTALTCLNETKYGRLSKKKKMFKAALNPEVMLNILFKRKK